MPTQMKCPMCDDGNLVHTPIGNADDPEDQTHSYICDNDDTCPFVGIEFYNSQNTEDLHNSLNK